uniref:PDZ and pleckstrin homology domains 1 n=1 Tax=Bos indicus x Bos taurus TaxID=30522 RepID=A0A4W2EPK5_BOBOX
PQTKRETNRQMGIAADQACQKNIKDLEKEVKGDTAGALFHQTGALGKSQESGDDHTSAATSRKQKSPFFPKDKKQLPSESKIIKEKERDEPPSFLSDQSDKVLPAVTFNDCKEPLSEKIALRGFPNTSEALQPSKGKTVTDVRCGVVHVQVAIKNSCFCQTGIRLPTKKTCSRWYPCYSVRHSQRSDTSRSCSLKCKNLSVEEGQPKASSKSEGKIARTESPSLKVSIVGKGIKVKYVSKKENVLINITCPPKSLKIAKNRNIASSHSAEEGPESSAQSDTGCPEKWQLEDKRHSSGCLHVSPPTVFGLQKEENFDTVVVSLCSSPDSEKNKPDTVPSVSDDCAVESAIFQQKNCAVSKNTPQKKRVSEAETLLTNILPTSRSTLKTTSLSDTDLSKTPFEDPTDVNRDRKIISDKPEKITSDPDTQPSPDGINYLPSSITDIFLVQDDKGSDFGSSSLSVQFVGEKASNIYCKGSKIPPADCYENSDSLSFPSIQNVLKSSTSFSPSPWAAGHSEPKETPGDPFSFNHCAEVLKDYGEGLTDVTERDFENTTLHSDPHTKAQLLEVKGTPHPPLSLTSSGNLSAGQPLGSSSCITAEWGQTGSWASHPDTAVPSKTKAPVMTLIADELDQRLIIQGDKEDTVYSNYSMGMKSPKEPPSSLGNVEKDKFHIIMPTAKNACYRDFEALAKENHDKVCFQMNFPDSAEFSCAMCATDNLFLMEKTLTTDDADQYGNQDEQSFGLTTCKQEPAGCQRTASTKPNPEENKNDPKETYDHQIDILFSPQKQKALKDGNLETSSLRKLSQELAPKGKRASDGSQEEALEQWARRRQQFRDGKRASSAGGSSFASNVTEGSVTSEDGCSVDLGFRVSIEEKGFYTENFHSAAWVFRGDDGNPEDSPRCLTKKPRPVAVRERTVKLVKGTGDYPWGFRIQYSKPIVVTEVDANSAAEEAGLQVGDVVLAVNGTEVTSVEHAEAVHLARKGPDLLTLVVGSDISRCPNTPRPACRGYLHKRTHSGFMKGWRKRWFVLKNDGCLQYYRHKKDEGKCSPLEVIKLEGAEVGIDSSLGKPFVFNCVPQSGNRTFCLCATSNQEFKRWLEAMDKAAHPVHQNHVWEGVTLHNSSLPPLAIKNPECLGLLHRLDGSTDVWMQHYCILKDGCLYFYASIRSTQASGGLYLQGYRVNEQTLSVNQSVIELKPPSEEFKTFYFCAENKTENQRWITALKMSIKKWLPLHQAIQDFMNRPLEETRM